MIRFFFKIFFSAFFAIWLLPIGCFAERANSSSYQLLDTLLLPGGYAVSSSFQLNGSFSQISIGASSASDFKLNAGFLYFPLVTTPVISATPGDSQVALSWTPSEGVLGWTAGSYLVGQSTSSGGPYSFTDLGLSTSATRTGLTNGLSYYFVIKVRDALGNDIATSTEVSSTPVASGGSVGGGGGGGGGSAPVSTKTGAIFSGRAFPLSDVNLLRDGRIVATTKAGPDANFRVEVTGLSAGIYNFGVNSTDSSGYRSITQSFPVTLTTGVMVTIGGIFIPPSIAVDKLEVKKGDNIAIFGQSVPNGEVTISVHSDPEIFTKVKTDKIGSYLYNFDTVPLEYGSHVTKSKASSAGEISQFGQSVAFKVGTQNIKSLLPQKCPSRGDLNGDCRVNLVDFSIGAYWYKRSLAGAIIQTEKNKLNGDGKIDLIDFSLIAYYWTG